MDLGADKLTTNPSVVSQETKEGAVLLEMTTGDCFELNHLGAVIWAALAKGEPLEDVIATLAHRYGVSPSTIETDTLGLIEDLRERGLLTTR